MRRAYIHGSGDRRMRRAELRQKAEDHEMIG